MLPTAEEPRRRASGPEGRAVPGPRSPSFGFPAVLASRGVWACRVSGREATWPGFGPGCRKLCDMSERVPARLDHKHPSLPPQWPNLTLEDDGHLLCAWAESPRQPPDVSAITGEREPPVCGQHQGLWGRQRNSIYAPGPGGTQPPVSISIFSSFRHLETQAT